MVLQNGFCLIACMFCRTAVYFRDRAPKAL